MPRPCSPALWRDAGFDDAALGDIQLTGAEPVLPSSFAVGTAAQATIAAAALAAAELWRLRTGRRQRVSVDMRRAAIEFRSERYLRVDGKAPDEYHDDIGGLYRCGDGRWARLHTNLAASSRRAAQIARLCRTTKPRCSARSTAGRPRRSRPRPPKPASSSPRAARSPSGIAIRKAARSRSCRCSASRKSATRRRRSSPRPSARSPACKVLDLTRIIAGPVCGRTLAAHGADVLLVTASHLAVDAARSSSIPAAANCRRRSICATASGRETLAALLRDADIFVQGYRPGAIAAHGFSPQDVARSAPASSMPRSAPTGTRARGPQRRGFDSLVQTASGLNDAEAEAFGSEPKPKRPLPAQVLDHATGYLLAFAVMAALKRRAEEGGSWHVRLSLAQTGYWLRQLGRIDGMTCPDPGFDDVRDCLEETASGFGRLTAVRHAAVMRETPPHWARPSVPLGTDAPAWPR